MLVGAGTLRVDDPRLSIRLPGHDARRLRVVLSASLQLGPATALFDAPGPIRIYSSQESIARRGAAHAKRATLIPTPIEADRLDLRFVLEDLARHGVQSILVEGGARVFVCPACAEAAGVTEEDLLPGVELASREAVFDPLDGRAVVFSY